MYKFRQHFNNKYFLIKICICGRNLRLHASLSVRQILFLHHLASAKFKNAKLFIYLFDSKSPNFTPTKITRHTVGRCEWLIVYVMWAIYSYLSYHGENKIPFWWDDSYIGFVIVQYDVWLSFYSASSQALVAWNFPPCPFFLNCLLLYLFSYKIFLLFHLFLPINERVRVNLW